MSTFAIPPPRLAPRQGGTTVGAPQGPAACECFVSLATGDWWCDWNADCVTGPEDCDECDDGCTDGVWNNDETDIDCGGGTGPKCPDGWFRWEASDCLSDACLDCVCFPCDSARLAGNAPTTYTDGTCLPITNLRGFELYYGMTSGPDPTSCR